MKKILFLLVSSLGISSAASSQNAEYYFSQDDSSIQIFDLGISSEQDEFYLYTDYTSALKLVKLSSEKQIIWTKTLFEVNPYYDPSLLVSDAFLIVSGKSYTDTIISRSIIKLTSDGNFLWASKWNMDYYTEGYEIDKKPVLDDSNNIFVFTGTYYDTKVLKLDPNGTKIFSKRIINDTLATKNPSFELLKCTNGDFILTTKEESTCAINRFDRNFVKIWSKKYPIDSYNHPKTIIELADEKFLIGGYAVDFYGSFCAYTFVIDNAGNLLHKNYYFDPEGQRFPRKFKLLNTNEIIFCNEYGFVGKLNTNGEMINLQQINWAMSYYSILDYYEGNFVHASLDHVLYFQELKSEKCLSVTDFSIPLKSEQIIENGTAIDAQLYIKPLLFDFVEDFNVTVQNNTGLEFIKLCSSLNVDENITPAISIFPNPVLNKINIEGLSSFVSYELVNLHGEVVQKNTLKSSQIDVSSLNEGIYFLNLMSEDFSVVRTKIIKE